MTTNATAIELLKNMAARSKTWYFPYSDELFARVPTASQYLTFRRCK